MPQESASSREDTSLSTRVYRYLKEVQRLVSEGIEHPRYELTRECSLAKESPKTRIEFVKLVQGLANAHLQEERFLVVGADQREKKFFSVSNAGEFDPARVSQLLETFLDPIPSIEVFNLVQTGDGIPFVLIALDASQPRPIVASGDAADSEGKLLLRRGEIWIKRNTRLETATREDIEAMYLDRVEAEAETRATTRFAVLRDEIIALQQLHTAPGIRPPSKELIYGRDENFRVHVEHLIASADARGFFMLL